ncbi:MAG: helix-turn-helix domain-containing protein [Ardenticatenaceae bacterium]|nr:helix-turn-helix domain-containing protein [Ardenticatenaceae bacterium]MCB9443212.1 helix-turn-helix domain-containing protein [Ardenticatenaceae bacterium]
MTNNSLPTEVNIGDILRLALPLDTAVMAGAKQTRHNVLWVVLLTDWDELPDQARAGDLVLLPPIVQGQATTEQMLIKLQSLGEIGIAGLLAFQPLPDAFSRKANELDVPLLVTPTGTSIRETHRAIAALLIDRQTATSERGMQLYRKLSEMSREGQSLSAMTDVMANLTGKIVIVQDKRLEIQALSSPRNTDIDLSQLAEILTKRDELPALLRNRKAAAKARQSYWQQLLPIENMGRLISPIISGDRARGYLSVVGPADDLDFLDSLAVEHGAAAFALEMAKAKAVSEARKALRGDFLEGVLSGSLPKKEIERLAGRLDHDTSLPHAIMTFSWAGADTPSMRRLETAVNWVLANHNRSTLVHVYGDQHVCIFQTLKHNEDMEAAHSLGRRIYEETTNEFPDAHLISGASGPAMRLSDWPRVYQEALQAMELGERLKLNHVVDFHGLGVYQLLGQLEDIEVVRQFTQHVIGPLVEYDAQHRSSLVQTIDAYFDHHGNISQTAESLFIHRNTLLYRLERIKELTGQDLEQANMRLALQLALKLWQLQPES